jgi:hypothetical protein
MIVIVSKYLIPTGYKGLTIFPFIILKSKKDKLDIVLVNHERIHIQQQIELLFVPFFVWYFCEYIIRLLQFKDHYLAYKNIGFEKEAYAYEADLQYLKTRPLWSFLKYL